MKTFCAAFLAVFCAVSTVATQYHWQVPVAPSGGRPGGYPAAYVRGHLDTMSSNGPMLKAWQYDGYWIDGWRSGLWGLTLCADVQQTQLLPGQSLRVNVDVNRGGVVPLGATAWIYVWERVGDAWVMVWSERFSLAGFDLRAYSGIVAAAAAQPRALLVRVSTDHITPADLWPDNSRHAFGVDAKVKLIKF